MKASTALAMLLLVCSLTGLGIIGCNTFRGAGKDIQSGGKAVEEAAVKAQQREQPPNTITAWAELGGAISPSGSTSVPHGSSQTFTITPNLGYRVSDVRVDGKSLGPMSNYTFDKVTENHTISAFFAVNLDR